MFENGSRREEYGESDIRGCEKPEGMLGTLVEIYTDVFYEAKEEYWEKLDKIRKEGVFETFSSIEDLRKLIEED